MQRKACQLHKKCFDLSKESVICVGKGRRNQHAVVLQHATNFREGFLRFRYNVQRIDHDHHIEGLVSIGQMEHILHRKIEFRRFYALFCLLDHLLGCVGSFNMVSRANDMFGNQPCAGRQLQHGFLPHHRAQQFVQPLVSRCILAHETVVPPGVFVPEILTVSHDFVLTTRC